MPELTKVSRVFDRVDCIGGWSGAVQSRWSAAREADDDEGVGMRAWGWCRGLLVVFGLLLVLGVPAVAWQDELAGDVEERLGPLAARQLALDASVTGPVGRYVRAWLEGGTWVADLVLTADRPVDLGVVELQGVTETPEGRVVITAGGVVERTEQGDVVVVDAPRERVRLVAGEPWVAQLEVREQLRLTPQPVHAAVEVPLAVGTLRLDALFAPQRMVQVGAPRPRSFAPVRLPAPADGTFGVDVLPDGTPVFVGRDGDVVTVLGAQVQLHDDVPRSLIGWCASGATFEEPLFGTRYDARGRYAFGPGRHGMVPFIAELDGGDVVVSGTNWPQPRDAGADVARHSSVHDP